MKAGKELDKLIAEKIMGMPWRKPTHGTCCTCQTCGHSNESDCACGWSTDIEMAWRVVEKLGNWHEFIFIVWKRPNARWEAGWYENDYDGPERRAAAEGDTVAEAICLAALLT